MAKQRGTAVNITISLPHELLDYLDRKSCREGTSRSRLIGRVLTQLKAQAERRLAAAGYRFYAWEASEFARASMPALSEALDPALSIEPAREAHR